MIATGGTWDSTDRNVYFLAGDAPRWGVPHKHLLVAVNELAHPGTGELKDSMRVRMDEVLGMGTHLLIDSGIFWLTNEHMRAHGITMDEALALAPDAIDGFDWLWTSYLNVIREYGDVAWGFIELDQGGAVNKRKTRAQLNDLGVFPMPVYHPFNDGWDYFDELAETHDRICCGNVVQANNMVRKRLIATLAERHREYPGLWVHLLGYTPNEWVNALPVDSADSSSWLTSIRWDAPKDASMVKWWGQLSRHFQYRLGSDPSAPWGHHKAETLGVCSAVYAQRNWQQHQQRLVEELGARPYGV